MTHLLIALLLIWPAASFAGNLRVEGVTGASSFAISPLRSRVTIVGGVAGGNCAGSVDNSSTCNSCSSRVTTCGHPGLCACNPKRVHNNLVVRIALKKSDKVVGNAVAMTVAEKGGTYIAPVTGNNLGEFVDFTWSSICAAMGNSDCSALGDGPKAARLRIGIDINQDGQIGKEEPTVEATFKLVNPGRGLFDVYNEPTRDGFSGFQPFAGEGKVFIETVTAAKAFPLLLYGARAAALRIFVSDHSLREATYDFADITHDMVLDHTGRAFKSNEIKGLTNGTTYFFRIATVDEAGNVVQFLPGLSQLPDSCTTAPSSLCPYSATPSIPVPTP
jgi:hypothetical protein